MESFFDQAKNKLYPNTKTMLRLRISPSEAFRKAGKLLLPVQERISSTYNSPLSNGETPEEIWQAMVKTRLTPQEDVWVIKIFDSIQVYNGLKEKDTAHQPQQWDVTELSNGKSDDVHDDGWNIPHKSIMDGLAYVSTVLLHIDPQKDSRGIILRVIRGQQYSEWLTWEPSMEFEDFLCDVLYKIDRPAIEIYPGDHVVSITEIFLETLTENVQTESDEETMRTIDAIREKHRRNKTARDALKIFLSKDQSIPVPPDDPPIYRGRTDRGLEREMGLLRQKLMRAEAEILNREEKCKVCGLMFLKRSGGEDLERAVEIQKHYHSHVMAGPRDCSFVDCDEDLGNPEKYSTWSQLTEHLRLHPEESNVRNSISEAPPLPPPIRDSGTQTKTRKPEYDDGYVSDVTSTLTTNPTGNENLYCANCNKRVDLLTVEFNVNNRNTNPTQKQAPEEFAKGSKHVESHSRPARGRGRLTGDTGTAGSASNTTAPALGKRKRNATTKAAKDTNPPAPSEKTTKPTTAPKGGRGNKIDTTVQAATATQTTPSDLPAETTLSTAAAEGGQFKKPKFILKAPKRAQADPTTQQTTTAASGPSGSSSTHHTRVTTAATTTTTTADNPGIPTNPSSRTRKPRTQPVKAETRTLAEQFPDPPPISRRPRKKKAETVPEASQAEASTSATTTAPSTVAPPTTGETATSAPVPAPPRRTRGGTVAATSEGTTVTGTAPPPQADKKRKAAVSKTSSPAKKRKTAAVKGEEVEGGEVETQSTVPTGTGNTGSTLTPPGAAPGGGVADGEGDGNANDDGAEDNNDKENSTAAKGKAKAPPKTKAAPKPKPPPKPKAAPKPKAPPRTKAAPKTTTTTTTTFLPPLTPSTGPVTRSSPRKRKADTATTEAATKPPAGKKRKVATTGGGVGVEASSSAAAVAEEAEQLAGETTATTTTAAENTQAGNTSAGEGVVPTVEQTGSGAGEAGEGASSTASGTNKRKRTPTPKAGAAAEEEEEEEKGEEG
ncbi:MAG: hypothetical protein Q9168_006825 [Polycauliona sp. 1 TL-2023]